MAVIKGHCHFSPLFLTDGWGSVNFQCQKLLKMFYGTDPWRPIEMFANIFLIEESPFFQWLVSQRPTEIDANKFLIEESLFFQWLVNQTWSRLFFV